MTKSPFRLDYINHFKPGTFEKMDDLRSKFMALEKAIEDMTPDLFFSQYSNIARTHAETLTHLEQSQMYAIKMLCLIGEADE